MKLIAFTITSMLLAGCIKSKNKHSYDENNSHIEDVKAATQSWADAFNSRDLDKILSLYSTEAVFWGTVSPTLRYKPSEVRNYFIPIGPDARVLLGEQKTRHFGNVAVNTGYYTFSDVIDGKKATFPARFSFVYKLKENGIWLIVDHHSSTAPSPKAKD